MKIKQIIIWADQIQGYDVWLDCRPSMTLLMFQRCRAERAFVVATYVHSLDYVDVKSKSLVSVNHFYVAPAQRFYFL